MFDGQAAGAVCVVPGEFDAGKSGAGPVLGEFIVLEEDVAKVVGMAFANIFDAKVIDNESEEDWAPLVAPYARAGGELIVTCLVEAWPEELV